MALFNYTACRGISVAGGEVSPANGGPRHGDGNGCGGRWSCFLFFRLGPRGGGRRTTGGHCKHDTISTYNNIVRQQQIPERFDFLRLPLPHYPTTLRHRWQSAGQLHDWLGGAIPSRLSLCFLLRLRAHILCGPAAALSCSYASPFGLYSGAREKVVRPGDIGSWRVAAVQFSVSLQKVFCQRWRNKGRFQQKVVEYLQVWAVSVRCTVPAHTARRPRPAALA
jgi:hypothetical protein